MRLINKVAGTVAALAAAVCVAGVVTDGDARAAVQSTNVSAADKKFLDDAYSINEGEVRLGHLAEQRGTTAAVKDFAHRMVSDHTSSLDASKLVAAQAHLAMPTAVDAATKKLYEHLSARSGSAFDSDYLQAMVLGHEKAVRTFEHEATTGQNPAIKAFATTELPMLRDHLAFARQAQQEEKTGVAEPQRPY